MAMWLALALPSFAAAAEPFIRVVDADGQAVADAVVRLEPEPPASAPPPPPTPGSAAAADVEVVDQRNETFIPYVQIVPLGGEVVFRNSDQTRHQVYSFAPARPFEFVLAPGEASPPVRFEHSGVVAIGCNIHDQMIAYLYVSDARPIALSGADGRAVFPGIAPGRYTAHIWHPRLRPGRPEPAAEVVLADAAASASVALSLMAAHQHMIGRERARY
jgi:plastocyanin